MKYLVLMALCAALLLTSGCLTIEKQAKLPDGRDVYINLASGKATTDPVGGDGVANMPLMLSEPAPWISQVGTLGGSAPSPWGGLLGGIFGLLGTGVGVYTGFKNKKNKGLLNELIESIEGDTTAHEAAAGLKHTAGLKAVVANVTAGMSSA